MVVDVHLPFLRRRLGVSRSTPVCTMLRECKRGPMPLFWMRMVDHLWMRALARGPDGGMWFLLEESVRPAAAGPGGPGRGQLWAHHLLAGLRALGGAPGHGRRVAVGSGCGGVAEGAHGALGGVGEGPRWLTYLQAGVLAGRMQTGCPMLRGTQESLAAVVVQPLISM